MAILKMKIPFFSAFQIRRLFPFSLPAFMVLLAPVTYAGEGVSETSPYKIEPVKSKSPLDDQVSLSEHQSGKGGTTIYIKRVRGIGATRVLPTGRTKVPLALRFKGFGSLENLSLQSRHVRVHTSLGRNPWVVTEYCPGEDGHWVAASKTIRWRLRREKGDIVTDVPQALLAEAEGDLLVSWIDAYR